MGLIIFKKFLQSPELSIVLSADTHTHTTGHAHTQLTSTPRSESRSRRSPRPLEHRDHALFLAEGLGHAFVSLADDTSVSYLVTDVFRPEREHAVHPLDADLGLDYRLPAGELILSAKDEAAPTFAQAQEDGVLPTWQDCQQRYRDLAV